MLETVKQWLIQNSGWLSLIAFVALEYFFKPLRWAIPKLWSLLSRLFKPHVTLHFVARDFPSCYWGIGSLGDKPITSIVTRWHVTQAPGSGMPARLLKAHLLKSSLAKYLIHIQVVTMSDKYANTALEGVIPEGQTRDVTIHCSLSKVLKPEMRLKVHLAVEDQLANKHKLPPVMVLPLPRQVKRRQAL